MSSILTNKQEIRLYINVEDDTGRVRGKSSLQNAPNCWYLEYVTQTGLSDYFTIIPKGQYPSSYDPTSPEYDSWIESDDIFMKFWENSDELLVELNTAGLTNLENLVNKIYSTSDKLSDGIPIKGKHSAVKIVELLDFRKRIIKWLKSKISKTPITEILDEIFDHRMVKLHQIKYIDNFQTVVKNGIEYNLTKKQACTIKILYENASNGITEMAQSEIIEKVNKMRGVETEQARLRDTFKSRPTAWKELITKRIGGLKDGFMLNLD